METKIASTYATLTFVYLEKNLAEILGGNYGNNIKENLLSHGKYI